MSNPKPRGFAAFATVTAVAVALPLALPAQTSVDAVLDEQAKADAEVRRSQERIDALDEETSRMLTEYRQLGTEAERLETYNRQLAAQIESQREEIDALLRQLGEIDTTAQEVLPMMERMLATLGDFVELDLPFLQEERRARLRELEAMMRRADVTVSEKYRRIVEAYGVEMEYGRTIETYRGELTDGSGTRTVDFLRIGRIALLYQTLDGRDTGYWDAGAGRWVADRELRAAVRDGLRVAARQAAPSLLILPVPAPTEAL